mgnify:CR=1 FL=1
MKNYFYGFIASLLVYLGFTFNVSAQATLPENVDQYSVYVGLVVLAVEYLIANTNLIKANSTIDMIINFIKSIFGLNRYEK